MKTYAIKARLYKGKKTFDEQGNLTSDSHPIDLPIYGSLQWQNFIANVKNLGYTELSNIQTIELDNGKPVKEVDIPSHIAEEMKQAFIVNKDIPLTPEQKEIKELKEQMANLVASSNKQPKAKDNNTSSELDKARMDYKEVFGKDPHHKMKIEGIRESINNKN